MGLLNQILGGLAGKAFGRSPMGQMGGGRGRLMMSLLPVVLGMLANRQRGGGVGGLGGFGGLGGAAGLGGLGGLLEQFSRRGYGQEANSWVSTGPNMPLPPQALSDVFGDDRIADIAAQAGVSESEARDGLSELLPEVVDHLTPDGQLPAQDQLLASIDEYERQLPH